MKLLRWAALGSVIGLGGYWLLRYLKPEHSTLVLNNSVVLITGASSGIGRAYANAFARRGARLVLAARRAELLEAVRQEIEPYAADVLVVPTDVTDDAQLRALVEKTLDTFGQIDVLVNNAGLALSGPLQKEEPEAIRQLIGADLSSTIVLTRLCLPDMLARRAGWIVNVASAAGRSPTPPAPVYAAAKAGQVVFSDALRRQLTNTGVEVIAVLPFFTYTDMVPPAAEQFLVDRGFQLDTAEYVAERTIDGILQGQHEIVFGGLAVRLGIWFERHFPWLASLGWRALLTPQVIATFDYE